jgi:hypothetical protein
MGDLSRWRLLRPGPHAQTCQTAKPAAVAFSSFRGELLQRYARGDHFCWTRSLQVFISCADFRHGGIAPSTANPFSLFANGY